MPKIRVISGKKLIKIFEDFGFEIVSQKGSHIKMARGGEVLVIPNHSSIAKGTLKEIYSQALEFISGADLRKIFYT